MGLTIHYDIKSDAKSFQTAKKRVEQMRQLALDLPFESVDNAVQVLRQPDIGRILKDRPTAGPESNMIWTCIEGGTYVTPPWNKHHSISVQAKSMIFFNIRLGPGSEWAGIGLRVLPKTVPVEYRYDEDFTYYTPQLSEYGTTWPRFDYGKFRRADNRAHAKQLTRAWHQANPGKTPAPHPLRIVETRQVPVPHSDGFSWGAFCKTQYASNPKCGGIPNFVRCHVGLITLLDRIAKLDGIKVRINDEGHYGPATYSDDYREAMDAKREPTYRRHKASYDVKKLVAQVGDYNEFIAAFGGALSNVASAAGMRVEAPIKDYPNFEQLEFRGARTQPKLLEFLNNCRDRAKELTPAGAEDE